MTFTVYLLRVFYTSPLEVTVVKCAQMFLKKSGKYAARHVSIEVGPYKSKELKVTKEKNTSLISWGSAQPTRHVFVLFEFCLKAFNNLAFSKLFNNYHFVCVFL